MKTFDVVAVNVETSAVRVIAKNKDQKNAEAIVSLAVMRRGVDEEFFSECEFNKYNDGDKWVGA